MRHDVMCSLIAREAMREWERRGSRLKSHSLRSRISVKRTSSATEIHDDDLRHCDVTTALLVAAHVVVARADSASNFCTWRRRVYSFLLSGKIDCAKYNQEERIKDDPSGSGRRSGGKRQQRSSLLRASCQLFVRLSRRTHYCVCTLNRETAHKSGSIKKTKTTQQTVTKYKLKSERK